MGTCADAAQVYTLLNTVAGMALGKAVISVVNTEGLVSLGETVLSSSDNTSAFYSALAGVIGWTYSSYRTLPEVRNGLMRTPLEFGGILRKLDVKTIARNIANSSWDNSDPITEMIRNDQTDAVCHYYADRGTFEIDTKVIYDYQLKAAFSDESSMAAFIDMVFQDMYNGMELNIRNCENLTICTAIAAASTVELTSNCCINVLYEYNQAFSKTLQAEDALRDADFLRFAAAEIKKHKVFMEDPSALYNPLAYEKWTPESECNILVYEEFAANIATYLQSSTFHDEMVKLPRYKEKSFWQGAGTGSTADRTQVLIERGTVGVDDVDIAVNGVIACMFDTETMGIMIDFIRTKSDYKPKYEHTEYYHKADWASYVAPGQQICVFYIDNYYPLTVPAGDVSDWSNKYVNYFTKDGSDGSYDAATSTYDATAQYYKKQPTS